jgi:glycogen synthase
MHVCFLCDEYPPCQHGGVGAMVQALGRALVERGHRVTVVGLL